MLPKTHLIYFSPTGTTSKIVKQVAAGFDSRDVEHHNLPEDGWIRNSRCALTTDSQSLEYRSMPDKKALGSNAKCLSLFYLRSLT